MIQAVAIKDKSDSSETNLKAGKRLFITYCMSCHGADREGSGNYYPSIIGVEKKYGPGSFDSLLQTRPAYDARIPSDRLRMKRKAIASYVLNQKAIQQIPFIAKKNTGEEHFFLPYTITGYNKFLSSRGAPAIPPPLGNAKQL